MIDDRVGSEPHSPKVLQLCEIDRGMKLRLVVSGEPNIVEEPLTTGSFRSSTALYSCKSSELEHHIFIRLEAIDAVIKQYCC